jgi:hypothetical protein
MIAGLICLYLVGATIGMLFILAAVFNWDWFISERYVWLPEAIKRGIYALTGFMLVLQLGIRIVNMLFPDFPR